MKRKLFLIFLICAYFFPSQAQTVDSLYACVRTDNKVNYEQANKLIVALDALGCVDSFYVFNKKSSQVEMLGAICLYMSYYYHDNAQFIPALKMCMEAEKYAEMNGNLETQSAVYSTMATIFHRLGDNEHALLTTRKGLHIDSLNNDPNGLSTSYNNMAAIVMAMGKPQDAIAYELKAIEYEKPLQNPSRLAVRYGILSEAYLNNKQGEEAMRYAQLAYDIDRQTGNPLGIARRLSQMGDAYFFMEDFKHAETLYLRADELLTQINEPNSLSVNCKQLGELYLEQGLNEKAVEWLLKADKICAETGNRFIRAAVNEQISTALKDNDIARSRKHLLYAKSLKDSIKTDKLLIYSAEYKALFDAQAKDENLLQSQRQQRILWCVASVVIVALLLCIFFLYRKQRKTKQQLVNDNATTADGETSETVSAENIISPSALALKNFDAEQKKFIMSIVDYVNSNLANSTLSVEDVASHMCMSRSQLNRRVNAILGGNGTIALINATRMERACRLLKSTNKPINEISMECGFNDHSYFNRVFRATFAMTPKQYRNLPENLIDHSQQE